MGLLQIDLSHALAGVWFCQLNSLRLEFWGSCEGLKMASAPRDFSGRRWSLLLLLVAAAGCLLGCWIPGLLVGNILMVLPAPKELDAPN